MPAIGVLWRVEERNKKAKGAVCLHALHGGKERGSLMVMRKGGTIAQREMWDDGSEMVGHLRA